MLTSNILEKPVQTEKATALGEKHHQVTFRVGLTANKYQIRTAVQAAYGVAVLKVRTLVMRGKVKRRGQSVGKRPNWKKAIVKLASGDNIDFFAVD